MPKKKLGRQKWLPNQRKPPKFTPTQRLCANPGCNTPFLAKRSGQIFHKPKCRQAVFAAKKQEEAIRQALKDYQLKQVPVAWRVKDFADGWILFNDEKKAQRESLATGALLEPLYSQRLILDEKEKGQCR
jgi:hypothetical protein